MPRREITFDRFIRGLVFVAVVAALCLTIDYLSAVLIPFFAAWALAYILYPVVNFLQYKCRLRWRMLCVLITVSLVFGAVGALLYMAVPTMVDELIHLKDVAIAYLSGTMSADNIPPGLQRFLHEHSDDIRLEEILSEDDIVSALRNTLPKVWSVLLSTANIVISVLSSLIALLYLVFLLYDYELVKNNWIRFIPHRHRSMARKVMADVDRGMSGYFRGQALVALSNCVMFSIGFMIIGFPMPVGLGVFIGLISFVPYIQLLGFVPALILATLCAIETGRNFWMLMVGVSAVYVVVQIIQDAIVTPHVMGKIMGLRPAVVLLSLTVWGYVFGIVGLIIALPATQLIVSYYRRYVVGDPLENDKTKD